MRSKSPQAALKAMQASCGYWLTPICVKRGCPSLTRTREFRPAAECLNWNLRFLWLGAILVAYQSFTRNTRICPDGDLVSGQMFSSPGPAHGGSRLSKGINGSER
jgi:hypothetical protein